MKEETKSKLKKFGKVAGYVLGLFAMLLLGVGLGNCSANGKRAQSQSVPASSLQQQRAVQPKRALDPANYPTLGDDENNLLRDANGGHCYLSWNDGQDGYNFVASSSADAYLIQLPAGAYIVDYVASSDSWRGNYMAINESGAAQVRKVFNGEPVGRAFLERAMYAASNSFAGGTRRSVINITSDYPYFFGGLFQGGVISLTLYDPLLVSAVASFDFPVIFNPYALGGSPANGDFIFNGPSVNAVQTDVIRINNLLFRSNGKLYDSIWFSVTHDVNQTFGHYDASGNFVLDGTLGGSAWYFRNMVYRYGSQYADVVWNAKFENVDSNLAWKPSLVSGGLWVAQEYRHIEVLSFSGSSLLDLPATSLVAGSSVESVLKLLASYVPPAVEQMGNPFTLLKEGFSAVGGILSIQILPFMTLGTLIFVPLVVLVILAILKLLAK